MATVDSSQSKVNQHVSCPPIEESRDLVSVISSLTHLNAFLIKQIHLFTSAACQLA